MKKILISLSIILGALSACGSSAAASKAASESSEVSAPSAPSAPAAPAAPAAPSAPAAQAPASVTQVSAPAAQAPETEQKSYAIVTRSAAFVREQPSFTAELGTQCLMGSVVEILDENDGYWIKIQNDEPYKGYVTTMSLCRVSADELDAYNQAAKVIVTARHSAVYEEPNEESLMLSDLVDGDILVDMVPRCCREVVVMIAVLPGWKMVRLPDGKTGYVKQDDVCCYDHWKEGIRESWKDFTDNIVKTAYRYHGTPYLWGGESSKGFDCSGLTRHVFYMNGVLLPRNASQQAKTGKDLHIDYTAPMKQRCAPLRKGDLIFFGTPNGLSGKERVTHVGIYIANGEFIHCAQVVRVNSLYPGARNYYDGAERFFKATRHSPSTDPTF